MDADALTGAKYWKGQAQMLETQLDACRAERDLALRQGKESASAEFALRGEVRDLRAKLVYVQGLLTQAKAQAKA